jgi:hypothetical protein
METQVLCAMAALMAAPVAAASPNEMLYDCEITSNCAQEGRCVPQASKILFRLTGKEVERHGEGTYDITYDAAKAEARNVTPYGPILWAEAQGDGVINTLTTVGSKADETGEDRAAFMVWSQMTLTDPPVGTVKFLTCKGG